MAQNDFRVIAKKDTISQSRKHHLFRDMTLGKQLKRERKIRVETPRGDSLTEYRDVINSEGISRNLRKF